MGAENKQKVFCKVLSDFLNDIYKSYPDASLLIFIKLTDTLIATNPSKVVANFMQYVEPVKDKIKNKDESFFINGGLSKQVDTDNAFIHDEIDKIISIWKNSNTSLKTKEVIWKYFQVLVEIGEKIKNSKKTS